MMAYGKHGADAWLCRRGVEDVAPYNPATHPPRLFSMRNRQNDLADVFAFIENIVGFFGFFDRKDGVDRGFDESLFDLGVNVTDDTAEDLRFNGGGTGAKRASDDANVTDVDVFSGRFRSFVLPEPQS